MAHGEARAWWADVQHLRDDYERTDEARRRADEADLAARRRSRGHRHPDDVSAPRSLDRTEPADSYELILGSVAAPVRRTVVIRGRTVPAPTVPRVSDLERRRPARLPVGRLGAHPDRMALWALMMGLVLILVAILTADASAAAVIGH